MNYISHARTPEELKAEFCADIRRRIEFLDGQIRVIARGEAEKVRIARAINELSSMFDYWNKVEIVRPIRKRNGTRTQITPNL